MSKVIKMKMMMMMNHNNNNHQDVPTNPEEDQHGTPTNCTTNNQKHGKNNHRANSCTNLAQIVDPRSGERGLSLKLQDFVSSRLDEPSLPERDHSLPKGEVPRLSFNCSETHQTPTSSCLDELLSPERDDISLKTKTLRLSESSSSNQGKVLLFSPRRDKLAWAKTSDLAIVLACIIRHFIPNHIF
ncbi:hypothetical protein DEO72_LG11g2496 [Vigna unguiculata]|uniref:Uncharacterized protein n=1 Tax=Vigna unguiculata TaxID=3917 RepID=A0A4D6NT99_VIGUN|nr:hypothetical protein DEO72_LG11g2496 [Vigna unguiculata]